MLNFYLIFLILTLLIILVSSIISIRFKTSIYLNIIAIFALLINIAYFSDFFELPVQSFILILVLPIVLLLLGFNKLIRNNLKKIVLSSVHALGLFIVSSIILILPFEVFLPKSSVITGNMISNDSVVHSIFLEGFKHTRALDLPEFYNTSYPRGIHSLNYYISEISGAEEKNYILLISLTCIYALIIFVVKLIVSKKGWFSDVIAFGIFYPFLISITIYLNFYSQIAVIPFLLLFCYKVLDILKKNKLVEKVMLSIILASILNIYGVFSFTVAILFLGIAIILFGFKQRNLNFLISKKNLISILIFLISSSVAIYSTVNIVALQFSNELGNDLISSNGNIPNGFLSAIHLSGLWDPRVDYRGYLSGESSSFEYLAITLLLIISYLIIKIKNKKIKIIIFTLVFINVLSIIILKNYYIQFKYLTFLIPAITLGVLVYLSRLKKPIFKLLAIIVMFLLIAISFYTQYKYYKTLPVIHSVEFNELRSVTETFTTKGSALILSYNDWFHYYTDRHDDYAPLTVYLKKPYNNESIDYIIIDQAYDDQIEEYLLQNAYIGNIISSSDCLKNITDRYSVISIDCK